MKKFFLMVAFIATAFVQTGFAQHNHADNQASTLLPIYSNIKDALTTGNITLAASKATELVNALNSADTKIVSGTNRDALLQHAGKIAVDKSLKTQREYFADLSNEMIVLAKVSKLSAEPIYQMYCPMKKSNWLSSEKAVKNPYYGSSMLSCGKIVDTFK